MKKYIKPIVTVSAFKSESMICTSLGYGGGTSENGITGAEVSDREELVSEFDLDW